MKKSTKAVLLSALVFPGSGHLYLKKYMAALVLMAASLAALVYLVDKSMESAYQIVGQIQNGSVAPDAASISDLMSQQTSGPDALLLNIVNYLLIIFWIIGIIDSYRIGHSKDRQDEASTK